ncbi:hypothetical protein [Marinobacterium arenosum]|uniref:hypothetical protein n=1 Tax=Marinobacterium arenosum TaxID=2862496 RepID=UPI001C971267|nr:hypothetical protein [Marinobacterium arenosum]MBY4679028.1 hypothetical protein [Marinobacterium arenosum]
MRTECTTRKIAVLAVDGENFEVDGHFQGSERKARWYTIIKVADRSVCADQLSQFPTHASIRELIN